MNNQDNEVINSAYQILLESFDPQIRISQNIKHNKDKSNHNGTVNIFVGRSFLDGPGFGLKKLYCPLAGRSQT